MGEPSGSTPLIIPTHRPGAVASAGVSLIALGTGIGLYLTHRGARATGELRLDQSLAGDREPPLTLVARIVNLGLGPVVGAVLLLLLCLAIVRRHRAAGAVMGVAAAAGWLSVGVGKLIVARPRPPTAQVHALVRETGHNSFPSGHTAIAAAMVAGVVLALRCTGRSTRRAWIIGVPFVVLVALTRIYLGAHYLGDVAAAPVFVAGGVLIFTALLSMGLRTRSGCGG